MAAICMCPCYYILKVRYIVRLIWRRHGGAILCVHFIVIYIFFYTWTQLLFEMCMCVTFIPRMSSYNGCSTFILYYYCYYYHYYNYDYYDYYYYCYCRHHYRSRQIDRRWQIYIITTGNKFIFSILPIIRRHKKIMFFVWTEQNENYYIVPCRVSVTLPNKIHIDTLLLGCCWLKNVHINELESSKSSFISLYLCSFVRFFMKI